MITLLLALGLLEGDAMAETGPITAAPEATIVFPAVTGTGVTGPALPLGAVKAQRPLDPSDLRPYAFDFSQELGAAKIDEIEAVTVSPAGVAVGVLVEAASPRRPIIEAEVGQRVQLWLSVAGGYVSNTAFDGNGVDTGIAIKIRTDAQPFELIELTGVVNVRQK